MIFVDPRSGSGDILDRLIAFHVPAEHLLLPSGDVSFIGRGEHGSPVTIGIEMKTIHELVTAFDTGRFVGKQLPRLVANYDYRWLVVEGLWRYHDGDGVLEVLRGHDWVSLGFGSKRYMAREIAAFLFTIQLRGGVSLHLSANRGQTLHWLTVLYHWWTCKDFDRHRSHLSFYAPVPDRALFIKPSLVRRMAKELDGVLWEKSEAIAQHFSNPLQMCAANEAEWRKVPGIGKTLAERIVRALRGPNI